MSQDIPFTWAKTKQEFRDDLGNIKEVRFISLAEHTKDVLSVLHYLKGYLTKCNPFGVNKDQLLKLIEIVIQFHDIGKVLPCFQIKTIKNKDYKPFDIYCNIPHSILSALMVDVEQLEGIVADIINDKAKANTYTKYILSAIAYHHWRENFYDIVEGQTDVFKELYDLFENKNKWKVIEENIQKVYKELGIADQFNPYLNQQWLEGLNGNIAYAQYIIPPYLLYRLPQRLKIDDGSLKDWIIISGFTMLSDHFASYVEGQNEPDVCNDKIEIPGIDFKTIKERISEELREKIGKSYDEKNIWQFIEAEKYYKDNSILLAPTGMGKTEFAYLWSNGEKFFYTLPIRAAVNQIFERTKKIFGVDKSGLLHSDADVYVYGDGAETESMKVYETAKQLSLPAIVSTGDQFFPYALRPPSYERIFAKFSYSRLVIDEVQAYDPKAAAIVVKFIEHIVQMGGKFLLMTATLPNFIKKEIEARTDLKSNNILNLFKRDIRFESFVKHKIKLIVEPLRDEKLSYSGGTLDTIISKAVSNGGSRVLVVLNTIKQAQQVFDDLKKKSDGNIEIKLFHSRYTQQHRKKTEESLDSFIGNNDGSRADKRPKILVSTQTVEASLDLDADYLFTELAPWDAMIQRMGRTLRELRIDSIDTSELLLRRYGEESLPTNVFILSYQGKRNNKAIYESGGGFVYHSELLRTTLKAFDSAKSPNQNREKVRNESIQILDNNISEEDLKKWNNGNNHDLKSLETKSSYDLSESDKSILVERLYNCLRDADNKDSYLKDYWNMLQLLDSGFMSDRKSEAQKAFREIGDVTVIPSDQKAAFFGEVKKFNCLKEYAYVDFKQKIISKYTLNIQRYKVREFLYESTLVSNSLKTEEVLKDSKKLRKMQNWLWGIYFVDLEYSDVNGLIGIKDNWTIF